MSFVLVENVFIDFRAGNDLFYLCPLSFNFIGCFIKDFVNN